MEPVIEKSDFSGASVTKERASQQDSSEKIGSSNSIAEKKLVRKCDIHVLPAISLLFILTFLDRINIGNARIQGLEKDLNMKGHDFNIALLVFFIPYIIFEVPSNILIRRIAPSTWLALIMICWGVVTVCMGLTRSFAGLVVCRALLGLFEAGFFPGCVYLISMYYRRYELQKRVTIFFSASILAGGFSGLLAYAISKLDGTGGYQGWRWIFIIEGLFTIVMAVFAKRYIADWPETSRFLNEEERALLNNRLIENSREAKMDRLDSAAIYRILGDWKIYAGILMYIGVVTTSYATSFFTPTILSELGWTAVHAQIFTIPIYAVAFLVTVIIALYADHIRHRFAFAMLGILVATTGYIILLAQEHIPVRAKYLAIYLVTSGGYITQPVIIVWLNNNMGGHFKRCFGSAMQIGFGNLGGIIASNIFITSDAPLYPAGYGVSLAMLWACGLACIVFAIGLKRENSKRNRGGRDERYNFPKEELENLGDDHPSFRFTF